MSRHSFTVNGKSHTVDVEPTTPLLYVLRNDVGLTGPRFGCGLGQCGACTVLVRATARGEERRPGAPAEEAVRSCTRPVSAFQGAEITTLEGLAKDGQLHPLQVAWIEEQVPQCGFCQNGQILTAKALLDKNPHPTDAEIRDGMANTLCRCMTYYRIQAAIRRVAGGTGTAAARGEEVAR
jgi:aerobic-type carbon monoxide dehydrogenase small subunit (CoxS/CutS family)